jgi:ABC-type multidrug transport system fused ATPase/permease subunit
MKIIDNDTLFFIDIIKKYAEKHPTHLAIQLFLSLAWPCESIFTPFFVGKFGAAVADGDSEKIATSLISLGSLNVLTVFAYEIDNALINDISNSMREIVFEEYLKTIISQEKQNMKSDLENVAIVSKMNSLASSIVFYNRQIISIIPSIVSMSVQTMQMSRFDGILASCIGAMMIGSTSLLCAAHFGCSDTNNEHKNAQRNINNHIDEILTHRHTIIFSGKQQDEMDILQEKNKKSRQSSRKAVLFSSIFTVSLSVFSIVCTIIFFSRLNILLKKSVKNTKQKVEFSTTALATILKAFDNVSNISDKIYSLSKNFANTKNILSELNKNSINNDKNNNNEDRNNNHDHDNEDDKYSITLKNIEFSYENQTHTLFENLNVKFFKNHVNIITGKIGCGKSTILNLIMGMLKPSTGSIHVNGHDVFSDKNEFDVFENVALVKQNPILLNRNIFENIIYGASKSCSKRDVTNILNKFNIVFKKSLDESVGKNGSNLSGGQRQLIVMLRLFFQNKSILLMDEPTSSVDSNLKHIFAEIIEEFSKSKTIIVITHDLQFENLLKKFENVKILKI